MERNQGDLGASVYTVSKLLALYEGDKKEQSTLYSEFMQTGFKDLDQEIGAFEKGNLVVIAAPPAMGKRPFVLSLINNMNDSVKETTPSIRYFSLELNAQRLIKFMITNVTGIPLRQFAENMGEAGSDLGMYALLNEIINRNVLIDEERFEDFLDLISSIRHDQQVHKSEVFVIDYLQLLGQCKNSKRETNLCLKALKRLAEEYEVLIIILSRISRAIEKDKDRKPALRYLNELGDFKKYAKYILLLHRPEYYGFLTNKKGKSQAGLLYVHGFRTDQQRKFKVRMRIEPAYIRVLDYKSTEK